MLEISGHQTKCKKCLSHHAAVEILLHLTEGVRGRLSLARDDDADVGDSQGGVWLALRCPAVGDVNALGGVAADVGWTTGGRGLDELAALHQPLLPLIQHAVGRRHNTAVSQTKLHVSV